MKMHGIEYLNGQTHIDTGRPLTGVTHSCSYGCDGCEQGSNCWALRMIARNLPAFERARSTWTRNERGLRWTGEVVEMPDRLEALLKLPRDRFVFLDTMGDMFAHNASNEFIAAQFGVMAARQDCMFLVLSKQAGRMREWFDQLEGHRTAHGDLYTPMGWAVECAETMIPCPDAASRYVLHGWGLPKPIPRLPMPNLILGTSACTQATLESRWRDLAQVPARWRALSLTPSEPMNLKFVIPRDYEDYWVDTCYPKKRAPCPKPDLIIFDGSSGTGAWPTNVQHARDLLTQCRELGIRFRMKQVGSKPVEWVPEYTDIGTDVGCLQSLAISHASGGDLAELPEDLRVREWLW